MTPGQVKHAAKLIASIEELDKALEHMRASRHEHTVSFPRVDDIDTTFVIEVHCIAKHDQMNFLQSIRDKYAKELGELGVDPLPRAR